MHFNLITIPSDTPRTPLKGGLFKRALRNLLGMSATQFHEHIKHLLPLAESIERLTPALAHNGPNVEYPWESPNREIHIPLRYSFPALRELRRLPGTNLIKIVNLVQQQFYRLFT